VREQSEIAEHSKGIVRGQSTVRAEHSEGTVRDHSERAQSTVRAQ
jgi:riboflavin biosynthesis pyrimidine reductase